MSPDERDKQEHAEIAQVLRTPSGRNLLNRILDLCGTYSSTFTADPIKHAYNAGGRERGLQIEQMLKQAAPGEFSTMMKERESNAT